MRRAILTAAVAAVLPLMASQGAQAAACLTSDVSLTIGSTVYSPVGCADNVAQGGGPLVETTALGTGLGQALTYLDKDDAAGAVFQGILFTVTADAGSTSGNWTVSWQDTNGADPLNLPITIDFAVALFGGNIGAGYLFNDVLLPIDPNTGSGTFNITFLNNGGQTPGLSHLLLAGTDARECTVNCGGDPNIDVPEPASMLLLGMGLLGLGAYRRWKN